MLQNYKLLRFAFHVTNILYLQQRVMKRGNLLLITDRRRSIQLWAVRCLPYMALPLPLPLHYLVSDVLAYRLAPDTIPHVRDTVRGQRQVQPLIRQAAD